MMSELGFYSLLSQSGVSCCQITHVLTHDIQISLLSNWNKQTITDKTSPMTVTERVKTLHLHELYYYALTNIILV